MSFANNLKVIVPGTIFALALATAGLAYADQTDTGRADTLGQYISLKNQNFAPAGPAVQVTNQTRDQVKSSQADSGRADALGLAIQARNQNRVEANTALAATKSNTEHGQGSNQSGQ